MIYNFLFNNRLINYLSLRSSKILNNNFLRIFYWLSLFRIWKFLSFLLLHIDYLLLYIFNRLYVLFSVCYLSWYFNWNFIYDFFIINNRLILYSFSINRSSNFFFSNNRCLHHSLFNNWLSNNSFGYYWLGYNLSFNLRLAYNFLTLSNLRSWIQNLISQLSK